jgi:hypothetical protein
MRAIIIRTLLGAPPIACIMDCNFCSALWACGPPLDWKP